MESTAMHASKLNKYVCVVVVVVGGGGRQDFCRRCKVCLTADVRAVTAISHRRVSCTETLEAPANKAQILQTAMGTAVLISN